MDLKNFKVEDLTPERIQLLKDLNINTKVIESCKECPYYYVKDDNKNYCKKNDKVLIDAEEIPEKCPALGVDEVLVWE